MIADRTPIKDTAQGVNVFAGRAISCLGCVTLLSCALVLAGCGGPRYAKVSDRSPGEIRTGVIRTGVALHTVARGENFASIAARYHVSVELLTAENPSVDPQRLIVGTALSIPKLKPEVRRVETVEAPR